ncbi:hypothetical protein B9K06_16640 [Bacillus sp. OG2]|nr:hypothetical protein B9K06_16640 [Bacillus sp. OG2]
MLISKRLFLTGFAALSVLPGCGINEKDTYDDTAIRDMGSKQTENLISSPKEDSETNTKLTDPTRTSYEGENEAPRLILDENASNRISSMDMVNDAVVIKTNNRTFVAVKPGNDYQLAENSRQEIKQAMQGENSARTVYLTEDAEFYKHVKSYQDAIIAGKPVDQLYQEFIMLAEKTFPSLK